MTLLGSPDLLSSCNCTFLGSHFCLPPQCTWLTDEPGHTQECQPPSSITLYREAERKVQEKGHRFLIYCPFRASVLPPLDFGAYNVFCSIQNGVELNQNFLVLDQQKPRVGVLSSR